MQQIELNLGGTKVPYYCGLDISSVVADLLKNEDIDNFIFVCDSIVHKLHAAPFIHALAELANVVDIVLPPTETAKTMKTVEALCNEAIANGASRRSCVVAMGGGVIGNIAGTAAGLMYRGIRLVHLPTTLLAATDSVISLKQAVNSNHGKNHFGLYHAPTLIVADLATFETLPEREIRSGIGEMIKNTLTVAPESFDEIKKLITPTHRRSDIALHRLLTLAVNAKRGLMEGDGKEQRRALIFEYGHTLGHAIELADLRQRGSLSLAHGECVALGILVAAELSEDLLGLSGQLRFAHKTLVESAEMECRLPTNLAIDQVFEFVRRDNKRGYLSCGKDEIAMVLLREMGVPVTQQDVPLSAVKLRSIERATIAALSTPRPVRIAV